MKGDDIMKFHQLEKKYNLYGWMFVLPAVMVVFILFIYPVSVSILYSFTNKSILKKDFDFVGIKNYIFIFQSKEYWTTFLRSISWTFLSIIGQLTIGFIAALGLNKIVKSKGLYRTLLIIPWAFPSITIAFSWKWILNGVYGVVNNTLQSMGLINEPIGFLSDPRYVIWTLLFIYTWFGSPLFMVNILAALQTIPKDQYEAAKIDGASAWQSFRNITIRYIRNIIGLLVVLKTVWIFNNFDFIYLLTGGGPASKSTMLPIFIYDMAWNTKKVGVASASALTLLVFLMILVSLYFKLLDRWEGTDDR